MKNQSLSKKVQEYPLQIAILDLKANSICLGFLFSCEMNGFDTGYV